MKDSKEGAQRFLREEELSHLRCNSQDRTLPEFHEDEGRDVGESLEFYINLLMKLIPSMDLIYQQHASEKAENSDRSIIPDYSRYIYKHPNQSSQPEDAKKKTIGDSHNVLNASYSTRASSGNVQLQAKIKDLSSKFQKNWRASRLRVPGLFLRDVIAVFI